MHKLPEYFKIKARPIANNENIISGDKYRFTLLSKNVIRMEYSENNSFIDLPSQTIWNREFSKVDFTVVDGENNLEIKTSEFHLIYQKGKVFDSGSLKIKRIANNNYYFFGDDCYNHNRKGTARTLDNVDGNLKLEEGLFSELGYVVIDDSNTLLIDENGWIRKRDYNQIDTYYMGFGNEYIKGLQTFSNISGKSPLIPRYALGNWWSRYWKYDENSLKEVINNFEVAEIPLSVCIIDMDWHTVDIPKKYGIGWTGYTWNKDLFPSPKRMLDYIKDKNLKTALNLHPADGVRAHEEQYLDFAKFMEVDYENEEPIEFDSTNPKFIDGYFKYLHHPIEKLGVDFWWIDWQQGNTSKVEGLDPLWMLNHYHYYDMMKGNTRPMIFSRWSKLGSHRYPIGFSGDTVVSWESLNFQPYFTSNASNVSFGYWSHDIGGHFKGTEQKELYTRWVQFGVFSPIMRLHSSCSIFARREPWKWGKDTLEVVKRYMSLRHRLIPYIYSMNYRNYNESIPMITPLYYYHENDGKAYKYKNEYYFGSQMLVSPITEQHTKNFTVTMQEVYLPKGNWYDFFSGTFFKGEQTYNIPYTIEEYPVFVKEGSIIPLAVYENLNETKQTAEMEIHIYPGTNNEFVLYEDSCDDIKYLDNEFSTTTFKITTEDNTIKLTFAASENVKYIPDNRKYKLIFHNLGNNIICNKDYKYIDGNIVIESDNLSDIITIDGENFVQRNVPNYRDKLYSILLVAEIPQEEKHEVWSIIDSDSTSAQKTIELLKVGKTIDSTLINLVISIINSAE